MSQLLYLINNTQCSSGVRNEGGGCRGAMSPPIFFNGGLGPPIFTHAHTTLDALHL